jgi:hypothetical protein
MRVVRGLFFWNSVELKLVRFLMSSFAAPAARSIIARETIFLVRADGFFVSSVFILPNVKSQTFRGLTHKAAQPRLGQSSKLSVVAGSAL